MEFTVLLARGSFDSPGDKLQLTCRRLADASYSLSLRSGTAQRDVHLHFPFIS